ncbi:MAG: alpha/beta hydrolase [Bacteroidetes bacterium OLB11]|nr:MAG: alpha/beta hydrolase [Bacteroidetes bacterium OLB11]
MHEQLKFVQLKKDMRMAYIERGEKHKHAIVFIHGLANYHGVWLQNINELQKSFRCIAIDLPGNGYSGRDVEKISMEFYAESVIDFIEKLGLSRVTIAGHSMGGLVAMRAGLKAPTLITRMILYAPAGFEHFSKSERILFKSAITFGNFLNLDEAQVKQAIKASFFIENPIGDMLIKELSQIIQQNDRQKYRKMLEQSIDSMLEDPIINELENITQETMIFLGKKICLSQTDFYIQYPVAKLH